MWDIEFLQTIPELDNVVIYVYRGKSGILVPAVKKTMTRAAMRKNFGVEDCKPQHAATAMWGASTLFNDCPFVICEIDSQDRLPPSINRTLLHGLSSGQARNFALLVPDTNVLVRSADWASVKSHCTIIEEKLIGDRLLFSALRYLETASAIVPDLSLRSQPAFIDSFQEFLSDGDVEFAELSQAFNWRLLVYTNLETGQFDHVTFNRDNSQPHRLPGLNARLTRFVSYRRDVDLVDFIWAADRAYWAETWGARDLVKALYRLSARQLRGFRKRDPQRNVSEFDKVLSFVLWSCVLLAWESRLLSTPSNATYGFRASSDLSIVKLDRVAREFVARSGLSEGQDCLTGLWNELGCTLGRVGKGYADLYSESRRSWRRAPESEIATHARDWLDMSEARERVVHEVAEVLRSFSLSLPLFWLMRLQGLLEQISQPARPRDPQEGLKRGNQ